MILTDQEVERYARQVVMPEIGEVGQKKLLDAKVLILGAGGLGAPVIAGLAGAGVGHLTVIDDDEVELTNLNRQIIHSMDRLAMNKAESAALFSRSLNPDIQVDIKTGRFSEKNADTLVGSHDLVVDCTDNDETRYLVNRKCYQHKAPLIFAGAVILAIFLSLLATTPTYYRLVSLAAHDASLVIPDADPEDAPMTGFDLRSPSLLDGIAGVSQLLLDPDIMTLRVTGLGPAGESEVTLKADRFHAAVRMTFMAWLSGATVLIFAALTALRLFMRRHYSAPLQALIDTITEFSDDPTVATPIPEEMTRSREFSAAAEALDTLQHNTLLALRQRERLADIGEAVAKINHDIRNVLSSATLVADTILASEDPRVRRAAYRSLA